MTGTQTGTQKPKNRGENRGENPHTVILTKTGVKTGVKTRTRSAGGPPQIFPLSAGAVDKSYLKKRTGSGTGATFH